jgi:hypothetical protein
MEKVQDPSIVERLQSGLEVGLIIGILGVLVAAAVTYLV